jgi:hypothetical protein|tara:strand:- start:279 stop:455 length:177 start_codon:yes stop_codon:yes gene_type:complete
MARIIKTSFGEAVVKVEEEFINEEAAQEGETAEATTATVKDFRVHHVTYKLKDAIKND